MFVWQKVGIRCKLSTDTPKAIKIKSTKNVVSDTNINTRFFSKFIKVKDTVNLKIRRSRYTFNFCNYSYMHQHLHQHQHSSSVTNLCKTVLTPDNIENVQNKQNYCRLRWKNINTNKDWELVRVTNLNPAIINDFFCNFNNLWVGTSCTLTFDIFHKIAHWHKIAGITQSKNDITVLLALVRCFWSIIW